VFAVASVTDRLDGQLAGAAAWSPTFGKSPDPIADKR